VCGGGHPGQVFPVDYTPETWEVIKAG
jgi:hypothetical protein